MEGQKMEVVVDNGRDIFHTNSVSINHRPEEITIDFIQHSLRFNPGINGGEPKHTVIAKHNVVVMSPLVAKSLLNALKDNLEKYEVNINKINLPKPLKGKKKGKEEKEQKPGKIKTGKEEIRTSIDIENTDYLG